MSDQEQAKREASAAAAEMIQRLADHKRNHPVALVALDRDEHVARLLFKGLQQHYIDCLLSGRLDVWAKAAHAAVDLLANPAVPVEKNRTH